MKRARWSWGTKSRMDGGKRICWSGSQRRNVLSLILYESAAAPTASSAGAANAGGGRGDGASLSHGIGGRLSGRLSGAGLSTLGRGVTPTVCWYGRTGQLENSAGLEKRRAR